MAIPEPVDDGQPEPPPRRYRERVCTGTGWEVCDLEQDWRRVAHFPTSPTVTHTDAWELAKAESARLNAGGTPIDELPHEMQWTDWLPIAEAQADVERLTDEYPVTEFSDDNKQVRFGRNVLIGDLD